ncbi:hypothetical protein MKW98_014722 [Papaver atlanticum]|uniref:Uncharacterized protein n=1 Tax=Papaver atlanticum TaxID=357466 RepID=A0AAD4SHF7_9MAGN|nr:hypothetical protein MKW98_014722 [Papaver atlanticum]
MKKLGKKMKLSRRIPSWIRMTLITSSVITICLFIFVSSVLIDRQTYTSRTGILLKHVYEIVQEMKIGKDERLHRRPFKNEALSKHQRSRLKLLLGYLLALAHILELNPNASEETEQHCM